MNILSKKIVYDTFNKFRMCSTANNIHCNRLSGKVAVVTASTDGYIYIKVCQ